MLKCKRDSETRHTVMRDGGGETEGQEEGRGVSECGEGPRREQRPQTKVLGQTGPRGSARRCPTHPFCKKSET